jgi:iron complex outermembrane receptor protein
MKPYLKPFLLASCAVCISISGARGAQADDAAPVVDATTLPNATLETVVVTAEHRTEDLQNAPVAVTALSGEDLSQMGINSTGALNGVVPGLRIGTGSRELEVAIRGVTATNVGPQQDTPVAVYMDGVYLSRPSFIGSAFYDMERVEVLRGPQGTLFGRNATAGAINYISAKPVDTFEAAAEVSAGTYSSLTAKGMINVPLSDDLDARVAFMYSKHDGYEKSVHDVGDIDDQDVGSARIHLKYQPTEKLSIMISADTYNSGGNGPSTVDLIVTPTYTPKAAVGTYNSPFKNIARGYGGSIEATYDVGFAQVVSLSSYRNDYVEDMYDGDFDRGYKVTDRWNPAVAVSQEFRLVSAGDGPFQYIAGLYYFSSDDQDSNNIFTNAERTVGTASRGPEVGARSFAAYAQGTYSILDNLRLTGGIRYTVDHKNIDGRYTGTDVINYTGLTLIPGSVIEGNWSKPTFKGGAEWNVTDKSLLYANVSTGYKAGGLNATTIASLVSYDPETITSYEIGSKNEFLDGRLRLNLDGFYYDYNGVQLNSQLNTEGTTVRLTTNAAAAKIYGAELEASALVTDEFRIDGNLSWLPVAKFTSLPAALDVLFGNQNADLTGRRMPTAPKWMMNLSPQYTIPAFQGHLTFRADFQYTSDQVFTPFGTSPYEITPTTGLPFTVANNPYASAFQKAYTRTNLRIRYDADKNWYAEISADNIENARELTYAVFSATESPGAYLAPRLFGVTVGAKF